MAIETTTEELNHRDTFLEYGYITLGDPKLPEVIAIVEASGFKLKDVHLTGYENGRLQVFLSNYMFRKHKIPKPRY